MMSYHTLFESFLIQLQNGHWPFLKFVKIGSILSSETLNLLLICLKFTYQVVLGLTGCFGNDFSFLCVRNGERCSQKSDNVNTTYHHQLGSTCFLSALILSIEERSKSNFYNAQRPLGQFKLLLVHM